MSKYSPDQPKEWRLKPQKPQRKWWQWIIWWTYEYNDPGGWISLEEPLQKEENTILTFSHEGVMFGIMCHACGIVPYNANGIVNVSVSGKLKEIYHAEHMPDVEYR